MFCTFSFWIPAGTSFCQRHPEGHPKEDSQEQALSWGMGHKPMEEDKGDTGSAVHMPTVSHEKGSAPEGQVWECNLFVLYIFRVSTLGFKNSVFFKFSRRSVWGLLAQNKIHIHFEVLLIKVIPVYIQWRCVTVLVCVSSQRQYTVELLDRYCKALEAAVQISCRYNVPPLPGRTLILLNSNMSNSSKQDFCLPPDPEDDDETHEEEEEKLSVSVRATFFFLAPSFHFNFAKYYNYIYPLFISKFMEVAILLSLMIASSAEDSQLYLLQWKKVEEVNLKSDVLLDNVRSVKKQLMVWIFALCVSNILCRT